MIVLDPNNRQTTLRVDAEGRLLTDGGLGFINAASPRYGGFWNGTGNDSPAIQAAVDEAAASSRRRAVVLPPQVCMRDAVFVPINVTILGHSYVEGKVNTVLVPHASASFSTGFAFNLNTLDGTTPTGNVYDRPYVNRLSGIYANNYTTLLANWGLVVAFGGTIISDIYASRMPQILKKPNDNNGNNYTDNWLIERIHEYSNGAEPFYNSHHAIDIGPVGTATSGDALLIRTLNFPIPPAAPRKAIRVNRSTGARVADMVNGTLTFDDCSTVDIANYHSEYGQLIATRSNVAVRSSNWQIHDGRTEYPIECYGQGGGTGSYSLSLTDVGFRYGLSSNRGGPGAEIKSNTQVAIHLNNAFRVGLLSGSEGTQTGIRIHTSAGAEIAEWRDNAHYLSVRGTLVRGKAVGQHMQLLAAGFNGISGVFAISGYPSTLGAGTFYYRAQYIAKASPLEGRNSVYSEVSQTVTAGKQIGLSLDYGTNTPIAMVRFYRGTSTGSYTHYVDVPCIGAATFVDDGDTLSGWPWITRAASGTDSLALLAASYIVTPAGRVAVA